MTPRQRVNQSFAVCMAFVAAILGLLIFMIVTEEPKQPKEPPQCECPYDCDEIVKDYAECLDSLEKMTEAVEWMRGRR